MNRRLQTGWIPASRLEGGRDVLSCPVSVRPGHVGLRQVVASLKQLTGICANVARSALAHRARNVGRR